MRLENRDIRVTIITPGATETELLESITVDQVRKHFVEIGRAHV